MTYPVPKKLKPTKEGMEHLKRLMPSQRAVFIRYDKFGMIGIVINGRNKVEYHNPLFWTWE